MFEPAESRVKVESAAWPKPWEELYPGEKMVALR
jgi:hypothetical protein